MSRKSIALLLGASLALFSGFASAHDNVRFGVFVSGPVYSAPLYPYTPPPVYYAPPAPVYYAPRPYYYGPRYYGYERGYGYGYSHGNGYHNGWRNHRR